MLCSSKLPQGGALLAWHLLWTSPAQEGDLLVNIKGSYKSTKIASLRLPLLFRRTEIDFFRCEGSSSNALQLCLGCGRPRGWARLWPGRKNKLKYIKGKNDDNVETKKKTGWSHYCSVVLQLQVTPHTCISYWYWIYPEGSSKIHGLKVVVWAEWPHPLLHYRVEVSLLPVSRTRTVTETWWVASTGFSSPMAELRSWGGIFRVLQDRCKARNIVRVFRYCTYCGTEIVRSDFQIATKLLQET